MRSLQICVLFLAVLVAGCSDEPSTAEYAEDLEALITTMNSRLDELDVQLGTGGELEEIKSYAKERVLARTLFVADLRNLEPPKDLTELHDTAAEIMANLADAESAMADLVRDWDSTGDIVEIWETPEGIAAREADALAVVLCRGAQADFDQTADRANLEDVPWIPSEMKEVILVTFGCDADSR